MSVYTPLQEGSGWLMFLQQGVMAEGKDSKVGPIHHHGSTPSFRVHPNNWSMTIVQQPSLCVQKPS